MKLKSLKKPIKVDLKPLGLKEVVRYITAIAILLQLSNKELSFLLNIGNRISEIWNKSGVTFTIQYLTECLRLVGNFIAGKGLLNHKTWVSTYKNGLPKIIGIKGKVIFESLINDLNNNLPPKPISRALISVLSIFRAMSPKVHIPKFSTITDPFKGQCDTLPVNDIRGALNSLGALTYFENRKLESPTFFLSYKGGANSSVAFLSVGLDLIALMRNPSIWFNMVKFSLFHRFYYFALVMIVLSIILFPLILFPIDLVLGRLGIIEELRGKTRVIGITDQWTQWLFKPLHDVLYSFLDTLSVDGTREQHGPVKRLLEGGFSEFYSIDLSAATDRLPVSLQEDILNLLGLGGTLWRNILKRPYYYQGQPFNYSVGQPMGAYSSFAMLSLTNHVIMGVAMNSLKLTYDDSKPLYAILGDDVAIANEPLAFNYQWLMDSVLGVVINPIKGFEGNLIEFAKNWFYKSGVNLSPLGSKALLRSIRSPLFITSVIADYRLKQFPDSLKLELQVLTTFLGKLFNKEKFSQWKWLFSILGPQSGFWNLTESNLDVKSMEALFKEFLSEVGVPMTEVSMKYYFILTKRTWTPMRSISGLWFNFLKILSLIFRPLIWSNNKFKSLGINPRYTAVLATASLLAVILPVLVFKLIKNMWITLWLVSLSLVLTLFGYPYINKSVRYRLKYFGNTVKRWKHNFFLTWDLVNSGKAQAQTPFSNWNRPKVPINRVLNSAILFDRWLRGLKFDRPIQFLVERVKSSSEDELPAVKTAERVLSSLNKDYNSWNSKVKKEIKKISNFKRNSKNNLSNNRRSKKVSQKTKSL